MKSFALLTALVSGLACSALQTQAPAPPLKVLSYNIHHGRGTDGVIDLERIARVIREADVQLVALQEVDRRTGRSGGVDQAAVLGELCGMEVAYGCAMPYDGGEYGEAVLSSLPIREVHVHPLPASAGHEPRAALEVRILHQGQEISFTGTHLDHTSDPTDRISQSEEMVRALQFEGPALLLGDLNATPGEESMERLDPHWTRVPSGSTFPSDSPTKAIDHVFFRPADQWVLEGWSVLDEPVPSDHAPLRAVLRLADR